MTRKFTLSLLAIFLAISFSLNAQVVSMAPQNGVLPAILNSAGGSYDNPSSYHRYEWSIGELVLVQTFATPDSSLVLSQGVLQECTDAIISPSHIYEFANGDYKLFPNPTTGQFEVDFFVKTSGMMSLQLINSTGQVLEQRSFYYPGCCQLEMFDLTRHPAGIYFVVADLKPDVLSPNGLEIRRHSGFKVVKFNK
jgi:hypothetical protein